MSGIASHEFPQLRPYDGLSLEATAALRGMAWPKPSSHARQDGGGAKGAFLRRRCEQTPGCVAVNSNGWMKRSAEGGLIATAREMTVWVRARGPPLPHDYVLRTLFSLQRELAMAAIEGGVSIMSPSVEKGEAEKAAEARCGVALQLLRGQGMSSSSAGTSTRGGQGAQEGVSSLRGALSRHESGGTERHMGMDARVELGLQWEVALAPLASVLAPSLVAGMDGSRLGGNHLLVHTAATVPGHTD